MLKKGDHELFSDFADSLKLRYIQRIKEIKDIFAVLDLKLEGLHDFKRKLRNCACILMRNGAVNVDRLYVLCECTKRMLEQAVEVDCSKKLQLIITDLENLLYHLLGILQQLRRDIRHHKNAVGMLTVEVKGENPKDRQDVDQLHENDNHLKKVLQLKQEISVKRAAVQKLHIHISEYQGLPPDITLAKKMLEEAKVKADILSNDLELMCRDSTYDTSSSFSP